MDWLDKVFDVAGKYADYDLNKEMREDKRDERLYEIDRKRYEIENKNNISELLILGVLILSGVGIFAYFFKN